MGESAPAPAKCEKSYFDVLGICCPSEMPLVKKLLEPLRGVQKVTVIVPSRTVIVVHDANTISQSRIVEALNQARLQASVRAYGTGAEKISNKWPSPFALVCGVLLSVSLFERFWHPLKWFAFAGAIVGLVPLFWRTMAAARRRTLDMVNILMLIAAMVGMAPEGSQFDAKNYDSKMQELLTQGETEEFFTSYDEVHESFDDMGLQENLLRGIYAYGFEKPSAIQQRGIVPFTKGLDVIQQAQSGTGKTATFCSGILQQLDYGLVECQALVLAPTRELAQQIEKVMRALGDYLGVKVHACVGGTSVREDQSVSVYILLYIKNIS